MEMERFSNMDKDFYTVEEIASLLRVQVSAVRNRLSRCDPTLPPSTRVGGRRLFPVASYEAWKKQLMDGTPVAMGTPAEEPRRGRPRNLTQGRLA